MLSDDIKQLELENAKLKAEVNFLKKQLELYKELTESYKKCCECIIPNQVYTHKARKNTTVKFLDGSQQTVTRKAGEKDCIETAIAYCILKQLLPAKDLKALVEHREEH